jgi:hypothetical protein
MTHNETIRNIGLEARHNKETTKTPRTQKKAFWTRIYTDELGLDGTDFGRSGCDDTNNQFDNAAVSYTMVALMTG